MRKLEYSQLPLVKNRNFSHARGAAVTVGVFDGIHRGHMKLLNEVTSDPHLESYVVTFHENPKKILYPDTFHGCILTQRQKLEHLEQHGIDTAVMIDFSSDFSKLRGEDFFDYLSGHIPMVKLVIGSNFRCGIGASFTAGMIEKYFEQTSVQTSIIEQLVHDDTNRVSSSYVRLLIKRGNMVKAAELLDKVYALDLTRCSVQQTGKVVHIDPEELTQLLPPPGLYRSSLVFDDAEGTLREGVLLIDRKSLRVRLQQPPGQQVGIKELLIVEKIPDDKEKSHPWL
jgi:riboflavin kinase / FMN adenylyltransferase